MSARRLVYVHQFFKHPGQSGITRSFHLSMALAEAGYEVHMITSRSSGPAAEAALHPRLHVHYLHVPYANEMGVARRFLAFLLFAIKAIWLLHHLPRPHLMYCTSTPLSVALVALHGKFWLKLPYIFEVRDLWPDFPIAMGAGGPAMVQRAFYALERQAYSQAVEVVALSPGIAVGVARQAPAAPITLLPNFSELRIFTPEGPATPLPHMQPGEYAVVYFGALGKANGLGALAEAAAASQKANLPLRFYLIGEGAEWAGLQAHIARLGLTRTHILGPIPKQDLPGMLRSATFSYVSFLPLPVLETTSPNKFFDSLAMGLIVVTNVDGWLRSLLQESEAGFYAPAHLPDAFVAGILPFLQDEMLGTTARQNARRLAESRFNATQAGQDVVRIVKRHLAL